MASNKCRIGDWKGHTMVIFGEDDAEFPFQFGRKKAMAVTEAIKEHGLLEVLDMIYSVAGERVPAELFTQLSGV